MDRLEEVQDSIIKVLQCLV